MGREIGVVRLSSILEEESVFVLFVVVSSGLNSFETFVFLLGLSDFWFSLSFLERFRETISLIISRFFLIESNFCFYHRDKFLDQYRKMLGLLV